MTEKDCPERFVAAARAALERRAEALDAETVARLADLRREALAQRRAPRRRWVEVAGAAYLLAGEGADWRGELAVPEDARGILRFQAVAKLENGARVGVSGGALIRKGR